MPGRYPKIAWLWVGVAVLALAWLAALRLFRADNYPERAGACSGNLKKLSRALLLYAEDYDGKLPAAKTWSDATLPYSDAEAFRCPASQAEAGYAFNINLADETTKRLRHPEARPLLFDSNRGVKNAADAVSSFALRHGGRGNVAYLNGHVRAVTRAPSAELRSGPAE